MNDNILAEGCKAGDRAVMKALYERFYSPMLGVCHRYAANHADAEDFVQDGFIKVFNNIHSFKGKGSLEGWIRRVIVNSMLMQLRKKKKELVFENMEIADEEISDEPLPDILNVSQKEVIGMIQTLPEGFRQVLNMYVIDGYKHREIAEMLNISVGTSKSQLNRARKLMKQRVTEHIKTNKD